jgi:hypothetical protein
MGIRLQSEFRTLKDDQYRIQIIDSAFSGTPTDVKVGGDGFTLTHDGETDAVYSPIVGSSIGFTIYNEGSAVDDFRTDLLNAQEKRFSVRIERWKKPQPTNVSLDYRNRVLGDDGIFEGGDCLNDALLALGVGTESRSNIWQQYDEARVLADGGTYEGGNCVVDAINALGGSTTIPDEEFQLFWTGFITQDLVEEADESKPRAIRLTATDGISLLSNVDFEFTLGSATTKSFVDALIEMLNDSGVGALFESNETMLTSVVNWYAEEMTFGADVDPLDITFTDWRAFTSYTTAAGRLYEPALDVIREMCLTFGARFYFDDGSFRFEQIGERDKINIRQFYYLNDGSLSSYETTQLDVLVDQTSVHRHDGVFRYLPAVKSVSLNLEKKSSANLIGGVVRYDSAFGDEIDFGLVPSADNGRVIMTMRSEIQTFISTPTSGVATPIFAVTIRLEPSDGTANQYWKNSTNSGITSFSQGSWSTTSGTYKWAAGNVSRQTSSLTASVHNLATGPLPKDGEIFVDITILGMYDAQGSSTSFFIGGNSYAWAVDLQTARFENDNNPSGIVSSTFTANNTNPNIGSNIKLELGTTRLGDGAGALGSLYINEGSGNTTSTGWRQGNSGSYVDIAQMTTGEILSLQNKVVNRFEGGVINGGLFHNRFRFDGAYWLPMRATFTANRDELNIEVFKIARITAFSDITSDPVQLTDPITSGDIFDATGGQYINTNSGVVGGMSVDGVQKTIGPFSETANGGAVEGDLDVTSNISATDVDASGDVNATGALTGATAQIAGQLDAGNTNVANLRARDVDATGAASIVGTTNLGDDVTMESDLEVQGDATTQGVTTQNGALVHDITDISHSDGSNYNVTASDYIMFNTWTGGGDNGEAIVTLPLATNNEGRLLRFKSDSTISANKRVNLRPSGSDTIDGDSSYTMNRSYDGITILAHDDRWYIIQRKEK